MEPFIELMMRNLEKNNFPQKRVSFDLETLYETAENKRLSLNNVLDEMKRRGVDHTKTGDKIIFFKAPEPQPTPSMSDFGSMASIFSPEMMARAHQMMQAMSPDELAEVQKNAQEMMQNMSPEERAQMMEQAKKAGMG